MKFAVLKASPMLFPAMNWQK